MLATILLASTLSALAQTDKKIIGAWECFDPDNPTEPIVRTWAYEGGTNFDADSIASGDEGANAVIEMNHMRAWAGYAEGVGDFERSWYIPTYISKDGTAQRAFNSFDIEGNLVGKFSDIDGVKFVTKCKKVR